MMTMMMYPCSSLTIILLLLAGGCTDHPLSSDMAPTNGDLAKSDLANDDLASSDLAGDDLDLKTIGQTDMAKPCTMTLSNSGLTDFVIRFRITTSASVTSAVAYQRSSCGAPTADWWDIRTNAIGQLGIDMGDGSGGVPSQTTDLTTTVSINDGAPHDVVFTRTSKILSVTVDGAAAGTPVSSLTYFDTLPSLGIASGNPCEGSGGDGTVSLVGTVTDVCIQHS